MIDEGKPQSEPHAEWAEDTLAQRIRAKRDKLLMQSDCTQLADTQYDDKTWAVYRQALRNIPQQSGFPDNVQWPDEPGTLT